jgi:hypothetical protein
VGNLIIKRVSYLGDKYYFESPEFDTGINIIEGDNGSGKSTLCYFIEFGLGGDIKVFSKTNKDEKYKRIANDNNNYIELVIKINDEEYILKRYINQNDVFIKFKDGKVKKYCVLRKHCDGEVFSDWLLDKLNIKRFELSLGTTNWFFNFNDVYRLLNYDQNTAPQKIFKSPNSENFVTDSLIIRKSIFETIMGKVSDEYFLKFNALNNAKLKRQEAKYILDEFEKQNPKLNLSLDAVKAEKDSLLEQMDKLVSSRNEYQKDNVKVDDKFKQIEEKKSELIKLELENSQKNIKKRSYIIEKEKIEKLLHIQKNEISSINKSIFTHEKLNLFDFEMCPFCAGEVKKEDKKCLCGNDISENNYEKFLYDTSEYKEILKHKEKSLESIEFSLTSYFEEIEELNKDLNSNYKKIEELNGFIKSAIETIEYSGNSKIIEDLDNKIGERKEKIFKYEELVKIYTQKEKNEKKFNRKDSLYKLEKEEFELMEKKYLESNKSMVLSFNRIYNNLMKDSSCKAEQAFINEDYMPVLDDGEYREKSAIVPKRMMYYFTLISMALKFDTIKHPKLLIMDTPEEAGIDDIAENIILFDKALDLSKKTSQTKIGSFQFILTTGHNERCPKEYEKFIKLRFRKEDGAFILKEKKNIDMKSLFEEIVNLTNWNYYNSNSNGDIREWNSNSEHIEFIKKFLDVSGKESIKDSFFTDELERVGISLDNFGRAIHTNSVFFIGCLLYEKLLLKERIKFIREDGEKDEFHFIWFLTSLVHDFGYFAEKDKSKFPYITEDVLSLNLKHDLLKYRNEWNSSNRNYLKEAYDEYSEPTKVIIDYIPDYFKEAFNGERSSGDKSKIEHGIYSGLVLYDGLVKNRLERRDNSSNSLGLYWKDDLDKFYAKASFSIAIHNMRRDGIVKDPGRLKFSLKDEPYLFLFGLADTIEPTKMYNCYNIEYILKNILFDIKENTIILQNSFNSELDFSEVIKKINGLESWLNVTVNSEENRVTIEIEN